MTEEAKPRGRKPAKVEVIAVRKFADDTGTMIEPGQSTFVLRATAIKLQDAGVIKVKL